MSSAIVLNVVMRSVVMLNVGAPVLFTPFGYVGSMCSSLPVGTKALRANRKDPESV